MNYNVLKKIIISILALLTLSSCGLVNGVSKNFAKELCSCLFVVKRTKPLCLEQSKQWMGIHSFEIDVKRKTVDASYFTKKAKARFIEPRLGCRLF